MLVYFVYLIIMISFIDTFSQLPIISPFAQSLGATPLLIGLVVGMYSFSNMIGNIFAGFWIDRDGAKRVLYIGLAATGFVLFLYTFVTTPIQLISVRFIHGVCGGFLVPAAFTFLASRSEREKKGKAMALSGAAVGLSAIIGPAFGGIVTSKFGIHWVFTVIGILMIVTSVVSLLLLPDSRAKKEKKVDTKKTSSLLDLFKVVPLFYAYLGSFSLMFGKGILAYMLPLKVQALNYGSELSGILMSTFGIAAILIFVLPTNRLFDRFSHDRTLVVGLLIIASSLISLSLVSAKIYMFATMVLYGAGFALVFPSINALIIQHTNEVDRGKAFGVFYAFFSLGVVVGSTLTGMIDVSANYTFIIGAAVLIVNSLIIFGIIQQQRLKFNA